MDFVTFLGTWTWFNIFTALVLIAPILGIWPLVRIHPSGGAESGTLWLTMPPKDHYGTDNPALHWKSVVAEELIEHYGRWLAVFAVLHPLVRLIPVQAGFEYYANLGAIVGAFVGCTWTLTALGERLIEYAGKAAFSITRGWPVDSEAELLLHAYAGFKGRTAEQNKPCLRRAAPIARVMLFVLALRMRRIKV